VILGETLEVIVSSKTHLHVQLRNAEARDYPCQVISELGRLSRGTDKTVVFIDHVGNRVELWEGRIL